MRIPKGNFGNVVAQPRQAAQVPAGAFVTGSGEALQRGGAQLSGIGAELAERVDLAGAMEAERKLADWQLKALYDPGSGAFSRKGKAAMGIVGPTLDQFDKETQSITQGLSTMGQKNAFQRLAQSRRMQIAVQVAAHERSESESYAKGEMKGFLQTSVNAAAMQFSSPEAVQQEIKRSAGALTAFAVSQGWSEDQTNAAVQAQTSEIHSAVAERLIQADPRKGMEYVQQNMPMFDAAEGTRLQKVAVQATEARMRLALTYEARADRLREKQEKLRAQNAAKAGDLLWTQGALTPDWIEKNRDTLDPADYRYFQNKLINDSPERTDPMIYTGLRNRLAVGEDVSVDAREALRLGLLKPEDFDRIEKIQERSSIAGEVPSAYKRGLKYIQGALRVSDLNPDPAAAQRQASAVNDWDDWVAANPNASDVEAQQTAQRIVRDYQLTDAMDSSLVKPMPSYAVGDRRDMDIDATAQSTVQAFLEKHGGDQQAALADPEFQRQAALIEQWRPIIERQQMIRTQEQGKRNERR